MTLRPFVLSFALLSVVACKSDFNPVDQYEQKHPVVVAPPAAVPNANYPPERVEHGRYLVGLLGCGSCHTNGSLVGTPDLQQLLAGSDTGIAWTNPLTTRYPGIVYPANLTPDIETGIGSWSVQDIVRMIQTGFSKHGGQTLPVMPWPSYANITAEDSTAIAMYLKSLPAVKHKVPANVRPGERAQAPFVHFGVYQSK